MEFILNKKKEHENFVTHTFLDTDGSEVHDKIKIIPTVRGTYFISENDDERVGKTEYSKGKKTFFLKTIKFGSPGEILADPINSNIHAAYSDTDNRSRTYEYTQVNEETFQIYVKYLYTKNSNYFQNVIRRLNNGEA